MVDIELQVVAGSLKDNPVALGDGVDKNDKTFLSEFPYLAAAEAYTARTRALFRRKANTALNDIFNRAHPQPGICARCRRPLKST